MRSAQEKRRRRRGSEWDACRTRKTDRAKPKNDGGGGTKWPRDDDGEKDDGAGDADDEDHTLGRPSTKERLVACGGDSSSRDNDESGDPDDETRRDDGESDNENGGGDDGDETRHDDEANAGDRPGTRVGLRACGAGGEENDDGSRDEERRPQGRLSQGDENEDENLEGTDGGGGGGATRGETRPRSESSGQTMPGAGGSGNTEGNADADDETGLNDRYNAGGRRTKVGLMGACGADDSEGGEETSVCDMQNCDTRRNSTH
jgi:hypothetical protein